MKMLLLSLVLSCFSSSSFAMSVSEARREVAQIAAHTDRLVGDCAQISSPAKIIKHKIGLIQAGLNSFAPTPYVEEALVDLSNGKKAVDYSLVECINYHGQDYSDGKNLLDTYLSNVDIDLMIAEHGIGKDGRKAK